MKIIDLNIPASGTWKRDCVLTSIKIYPDLILEFAKDSDQSQWKIYFSDFISIKITSEEFTSDKLLRELPEAGSFYEVIHSKWIEELMFSKNEILCKCKHFVFCFYDEVIEVISSSIKVNQTNNGE